MRCYILIMWNSKTPKNSRVQATASITGIIDGNLSRRIIVKPILILTALIVLILFLTPAPAADAPPQPRQPPLRIFLRAGPKTHGPANNGLHDGPTWLKE